MTFVFRQVLLRNTYVMSQDFQENRSFNPLTIFSLTGNLFNTILQIFLHRFMVKFYFGLVGIPSVWIDRDHVIFVILILLNEFQAKFMVFQKNFASK